MSSAALVVCAHAHTSEENGTIFLTCACVQTT